MWVQKAGGQGEQWRAEPPGRKTIVQFLGEVRLHRLETPLLSVEGSL